MKIISKVYRKMNGGKTITLYTVDNMQSDDEFVLSLKMAKLNFIHRVNIDKHIFTDGKVNVLSKNIKINEGYIDVIFKLDNASWYIEYNMGSVKVFVQNNILKDIVTSNKNLNKILDEYLDECINMMYHKKEFAQSMNVKSREMHLPFELVLAFKGNEGQLNEFVEGIECAINYEIYKDTYIMQNLLDKSHWCRMEIIEMLGIVVPEKLNPKTSHIICQYLYNCLEAKEIIRV